MRSVAAPLAAVLAAAALAGCGGDGAEPGASREATLVLDFQPNAVHAGIYAAAVRGEFEARGIDLRIQEPSASTDAPKLLASGRTEFAIMDIHDLGLARERGLDLVGIAALVQRPLAAVIAGDRARIAEPADLAGATVGVTGLPSDDAVLDAVLESGGVIPDDVDRVTIGFDSIAALSAGRVDAATAFWNAEGVVLRRLDVPTREFRVVDYGAPPYPELVVATSAELLAAEPQLVESFADGVEAGVASVRGDPDAALGELLEAVPALDRTEQRAQLDALLAGEAIGSTDLDGHILAEWAEWDREHGILSGALDVSEAFAME